MLLVDAVTPLHVFDALTETAVIRLAAARAHKAAGDELDALREAMAAKSYAEEAGGYLRFVKG